MGFCIRNKEGADEGFFRRQLSSPTAKTCVCLCCRAAISVGGASQRQPFALLALNTDPGSLQRSLLLTFILTVGSDALCAAFDASVTEVSEVEMFCTIINVQEEKSRGEERGPARVSR